MTNNTLHVRPADGLVVRDPDTGVQLPSGGKRVPNTTYWRRRRAAGDVVDVPAKAAKSRKTDSEA